MVERRQQPPARDNWARTRRTDRAGAPQTVKDWDTTFSLRWAEHLKRRGGPRGR
jgi:hypothetical protein